MQAVLANLQSLKIRAEYRYGDDIDWLDSVYLNSAPFTPTPTATATFTPTPTNTPLPSPTATPYCSGSQCEGWYPVFGGFCDGDGEPRMGRVIRDSSDNVIGEVRDMYSNNCSTQWVAVYNQSGTNMYAEGSIRWGVGEVYNYYTLGWQHNESPGSIESGGDPIVTYMHWTADPFYDYALGCGNLATSGPMTPQALGSFNKYDDYDLNYCIEFNLYP
jgi:hypothetical protein